jgi:methionyl-tRNA formyltransferase
MGLSPFPGAWCEMELGGKTQRVKILEAETHSLSGDAGAVLSDDLVIACKTGSVRLTKLQKAGSKAMSSQEFLLGNSLSIGAQLV